MPKIFRSDSGLYCGLAGLHVFSPHVVLHMSEDNCKRTGFKLDRLSNKEIFGQHYGLSMSRLGLEPSPELDKISPRKTNSVATSEEGEMWQLLTGCEIGNRKSSQL